MTTLKAKDLTMGEVQRLLGFVKLPSGSFADYLSLESLTELEQQELSQIRNDYDSYLTKGKVSDGLVKALTTYPLLRLAGFYRSPIQLSIEQDIANILIEDEDTSIAARLDILAVNRSRKLTPEVFFWVLVIESKNSAAAPSVGLPQLLTYAYKTLEQQPFVWGLVTNGELYQFALLRQGSSPTYQPMPILSLMEPPSALQLLRVLKAIRQAGEGDRE